MIGVSLFKFLLIASGVDYCVNPRDWILAYRLCQQVVGQTQITNDVSLPDFGPATQCFSAT